MTLQLHQKQRSKESLSDEYETPFDLFVDLCVKYDVRPGLDAAATLQNTLCVNFRTKEDDGLQGNWLLDTWVNPPHSRNEDFVRKAYEQNQKNNTNILMILPCNSMSSNYFFDCIEGGKAEFHAIKGRIRFLLDGKLSNYVSRNGYISVIWRSK